MPADLSPMVPVRYRVISRHEETADCVTLALEPLDHALAEPQPGQFMMLYAFGVGEVPISVSGCPAHDGALLHTIRSVGATSRALCNLHEGSVVGVRGPFGVGWDVGAAAGGDVLVAGGGIGLAPLRPVVRELLANRRRYEQVAVLVGARTPGDVLFASELQEWRDGGITVGVTVDVASARDWDGHVGVITTLLDPLPVRAERTTAYVCGPEIMLRVVSRALLDAGADPQRVFVSLERNMHCGIRHCGHCQIGPMFVCADGPVVAWTVAEPLMAVPRW